MTTTSVKSCIYDNPITLQRELWRSKELVRVVPLSEFDFRAAIFYPWDPGQYLGNCDMINADTVFNLNNIRG